MGYDGVLKARFDIAQKARFWRNKAVKVIKKYVLVPVRVPTCVPNLKLFEDICDAILVGGHHMGIGVQRLLDVGVAEAFADGYDGDAL